MSPSRILAIAPPAGGLRRHMDRRRHLARGARQPPVGDQRDLVAAILQHAERRHQLVQFRHADRLRSLEAHHRDEVAVEFAGLEGGVQFLLAVEHPRRRLDHMALRRDRRGLDDRPAERSLEHPQAAGRLERLARAAQHAAVAGLRRRLAPGDCAVRAEPRLDGIVGKLAPDGLRVAVQRARLREVRGSASPCRPRRGNDSRRPCRSDRSRVRSGVTSARSAKSSQLSAMPAAAAIATRWIVRLVEPPVACRPTTPLTIARSSMIRPIGVNWLPSAVIASARLTPSLVSASRSGVFGLTKDAPGRCRPMISISIWLVLAVP